MNRLRVAKFILGSIILFAAATDAGLLFGIAIRMINTPHKANDTTAVWEDRSLSRQDTKP